MMLNLRNTILSFMAASILFIPFLAVVPITQAQIDLNPDGIEKLPRATTVEGAQKKVGDVIISIINLMLSFSAILAVGAIIWGALTMIISVGDDGRVKQGKKIITWAIIGLLLTGFSFLIVQFVGNSLIK